MRTYRFSWDPFDDRTVCALAASIGFLGASESAREFLKTHVKRPDDDFVRETKHALASTWLPQHERVAAEIVRELFDLGIGPMGPMPADADGCARYIDRCRNSSRLRELLLRRLESFGDMDRTVEETFDETFVPRFGILEPRKQTTRTPRPFSHQSNAWIALDNHLKEAKTTGVFKGMLVMPTGAGKTHTAATWLLRNWIDDGRRVLWLAHRDELLRQAAHTFHRLVGLAPSRERLRIRLVSGRYCAFHQIDPADDVVLCSVQSLARALRDAEELLRDAALFLVIDEAHHAPAKSYRAAIGVLEGAASHRLLGLTATPTRTAEDERPELARLFGGRVLYQVSPSQLIAQELLARPIPITVTTGVEAEADMTHQDFEYLRDFHDVSNAMLARLGRDEQRNVLIVKHYLENRQKYRKTLVFTTDVEGAWRLADAFQARLPAGVHAEYVASWRPDAKPGESVDRVDILRRYADPASGHDVLINVDMLTWSSSATAIRRRRPDSTLQRSCNGFATESRYLHTFRSAGAPSATHASSRNSPERRTSEAVRSTRCWRSATRRSLVSSIRPLWNSGVPLTTRYANWNLLAKRRHRRAWCCSNRHLRILSGEGPAMICRHSLQRCSIVAARFLERGSSTTDRLNGRAASSRDGSA